MKISFNLNRAVRPKADSFELKKNKIICRIISPILENSFF